MSKGESPKSGWASFRLLRKQKLSRQSASCRPNPNNKVPCERLTRLVSLSLDVDVRWKFVGKSGTTVIRRKCMSILRLVRNFALLAVLALAAHAAAGAGKHANPHCGGGCRTSADCHGGCACIPFIFHNICAPKHP